MIALFNNSLKQRNLYRQVQAYSQYNFTEIVGGQKAVETSQSVIKQKVISDIKVKSFRIDRLNYTPHQYWITQGLGMERPFTGDKWQEKEVGYYNCSVCDSRLFTWEQKFQTPTGMASFWHHEKNAVKILDSDIGVKENTINVESANFGKKKRVCCNRCQSHLGLVFFDGPPPTFKRYSINSIALKFTKKEDFENPHLVSRKRKQKRLIESEEEARKRAVLNAQRVEEAQKKE